MSYHDDKFELRLINNVSKLGYQCYYSVGARIYAELIFTGYGDTIIASNPFDDMPPQQQVISMNHLGPRHMPCSPHMMHLPPGACQMGGSPMNCGAPMGSPMGPMNCGPMNCGPGMGSPLGPQRSPMVCNSGGGIMNCGPPQSSPMNHPMNRSPSVGSPLGPVMNAMGQSSGELECLSSIIPN